MSTGLEDLVRDSLAAGASGAPDGAGLLGAMHARLTRRRARQRWLVAGLAAAAAVAIMAGSIAYFRRPVVPPTDPSVVATQVVGFRGVEVRVPASWQLNNARCGTPLSDTAIVIDGPVSTCLMPQPPGLTVVTLSRRIPPGVALDHMRQVIVDGHSALRGLGKGPGVIVLDFLDLDVMISVESPDQAVADRILDTARVVTVDAVGCLAQVDRLTPDIAGLPPGAADRLVPGQPSSVAICRYADNRIHRSKAVPENRIGELVGMLNALPVGVSHAADGNDTSGDSCENEARRGFVVQAGYPDGSRLKVYVHISGCAGLSASNGARTTKLSEPLVNFLLDAAGYDVSFPNPHGLR